MDGEGPIVVMGAGLSGLAAATLLARAGREVHVHDIRADSGARFDGDFQALENWSMDADFFDQLETWGFDSTSFKSTSFSVVDLIHPDDEVTQAKTDGVAYRIVERGTSDHTIDQAFKRMAIEAGATLHYKSRIDEKDADIVACGPKDTSALALGEIFRTSHPNHIAFQLNDKLAPGAYSYLIIIDGVGLICTCLWRKQKKSERFLNECIATYQRLYPDIDMEPIKRVGGKGDFTLNGFYTVPETGQHFVGESGGLQDFMWGFGMRMAVWSGVLAAQEMLGGPSYDKEVRRQLLPYVQTSVANRWLMNRVGDRMFKRMCVRWMKDQNRSGDGLRWIGRLFRPSLLKRLVYATTSPFMLERGSGPTKPKRLPFRKAKPRDMWEQSEAALAVKARWEAARRGGGQTSFESRDGEAHETEATLV